MEFVACEIKQLPPGLIFQSAKKAVEINPMNAPQVQFFGLMGEQFSGRISDPVHIAVLTTKYWGTKGVDLTLGFLEPTSVELREKFLHYANRLGQTEAGKRFANVKFRWTNVDPQVRITREDSGYWSYLGTDILSIPAGRPTMCLQGFSLSTPSSEWERAYMHEVGHTLGFPHEHLRPELIQRLDEQKTIRYFSLTQGWSEATTRSNVLTPLDVRSITGTTVAEQDSIMCYQLPGSITKDGLPITGGTKLTAHDAEFIGKIYPTGDVVEPPPVSEEKTTVVIRTEGAVKGAAVVSTVSEAPVTIPNPENLSWTDIMGLLEILSDLLKKTPPPVSSGSSQITLEITGTPPTAKVVRVE